MHRIRYVAALALLAAGLGVVKGSTAVSGGPSTAPVTSANVQRFLSLTGDGRASATTLASSAQSAAGPAITSGTGRPSCGSGPTTPAGWCLTPAGRQYDVLRFPIGLAAADPSASSGKVVVSSDGGGTEGLGVIDPTVASPVGGVTFSPGANLFLGLAITPGGKVYASGGNADRVFRYQLAGPVAVPEDVTQAVEFPTHNATNAVQARLTGGIRALPVGDGVHVAGYPGESVFDAAHQLVFVGGTLSEPTGSGPGEVCPGGAAACARVSVIDTTKENTGTDPVVRRIAVGADTYGLALDAKHDKLFVANWGDEASRGAGVGTVSVVSLDHTTGLPQAEVAAIPVGHHPEALTLSPDHSHLYLTDTNDDLVTVIDTATNAVVGSIDVGIAGHGVGTQPDALAVSPNGSSLYVALAGLNAIQAIGLDQTTGLPASGGIVRYIPTGWYPSAIVAVPGATGPGSTRLWVANAKGIGFGPGLNGSVLVQGTTSGGTVNLIDVPALSAPQFAGWTNRVIANDGINASPDPCDARLHPSPVLCPNGAVPSAANPSPVKHVVYMVVENKTFDSYFGDIGHGYNADPTWLLFGQPVTPNQHAMATQGVGTLGDNFFSDAEVSVTGHSYTSGAAATDHNEKTWPAGYDQGLRGSHGNGDPLRPSVAQPSGSAAIDKVESTLNDPRGGYVFEKFLQAGAVDPATKAANPAAPLSMAIYGEHSTAAVGDSFHAKWTKPGGNVDWKAGDIQYFDSCRALLFVSGHVGGGNTPDTDQLRDCEKRQLDPQFTLQSWNDRFRATGQDVMPNFIYMSLPDNHTAGTNLGSPTPESMVADNDYAIGTIIQALSASPFWSSTEVIIVQDDTQLTGDHVSPLRDTLEVVGPWSAKAPDHQRASMGSVLRTIELLFGVDPVGVNDSLAAPLHGAFVSDLKQAHDCHAHATGPGKAPCYTAVRPLVPFAVNQVGAPGQAASMAMDWSHVDQIDMATLNAIWWATQHHTAYKAPAATKSAATKDGDG